VGPLKRLIIDKTEGNPLFMEEMVLVLFDEGALVRDGAETTYDFERLISPCAALFERDTEAFELLVLEADADAESRSDRRR
jgi:hypothetical protein